MNATQEEWRPVVGYEGSYEVSDHGRVRSLDRFVRSTSRRGKPYLMACRGKVLRPAANKTRSGHLHVILVGRTRTIHTLVAEAFLGPRPVGMEVRHLDDHPSNNNLSNLAYGTQSENVLDRVKNGIHHYAKRTQCNKGHEFTVQNTIIRSDGGRKCRKCHYGTARRYRDRKRLATQVSIPA